jgi:imidazolonepropionase-like amidohydrolase
MAFTDEQQGGAPPSAENPSIDQPEDSAENGSYLDDEGIDLMLSRGTALVPTLSVYYYTLKYGKDRGVAQYALDKSKRAHEAHVKGFLKAWDAGIPIGVGTDAGTPFNPHFGTYMEFVSMVELGCDPMDVLAAGTINSAKIVGADALHGSVSVGKKADFIVLSKNPIEDIWALKNVDQVYKDGRLVVLPDVEYLPHLD